MRKGVVGLLVLIVLHFNSYAQVDTSFVYKTGLPYGTLDIRIAKSATRYYYLEENKTVSFRESAPGVKTNTYRDMTSWDSSPYGEGNLREKNGTTSTFVMNYRLLTPNAYNPNYDPGYPLIIFLHGAGERGNCFNSTCYWADPSWNPTSNSPAAPTAADSKLLNNDHNLLHGGSVHLQMRNAAGTRLPNDPSLPQRSFPGFVVFPQSLNGWNGTSVQDAIRLVRLLSKKYNIDENRIYIEGLSQGGHGVYETLKRAPWMFAAAFTMSAVGDGGILNQNLQASISEIPLWTFQGGQDTNPSPARTEGIVKKFRQAGMLVRYNLYSNLGHGTWNTAMKETDYFKWMLAQNKSNIHTFAGSTAICLTTGDGVKMQVGEGFRAYQWEKNGAIIAGETTYKYTATTTGTYRVRFSRKANPGAADWNQWSAPVTVTQVNPPQAKMDQVGTVVLKDLNGLNEAKLKADPGFSRYYWYKNGVLMSIPDSVNEPVLKSTVGNGSITLVTTGFDNCPSPVSAAKAVFFNDSAPINLTTPGSFGATQPTANSIKLNWSDSSSGEVGFEVWRRMLVSGTTYTKWEMRTITSANASTFTDTPVEPSKTYNYRVRAVGSSGRSDYAPTTGNLVVVTTADSSAPTTPANLVAAQAGIQAIKLTWTGSTDNTGIRQYRIYYGSQSVLTGSNTTTHTLTNLPLNTNFSFTVKAEDMGGNLSAASNTASGNTYVSGLFYEHSTGAWIDLDDINWNAPPEFTGKVATFVLAPRTQEDFFNFEYDGFLYINTPGAYQFNATSSDGSRIELDGTMIVNNDGVHGSRTITSAFVTLSAGPHRINVKYFEFDESHVITIRYKGPDTNNSMISIPATALKSGNAGSSARMATEEVAVEKTVKFFNVFPNPTNESDINVILESGILLDEPETTIQDTPVQIKVVDFSGREVYQGQFTKDQIRNGVKIIPFEKMNNGIYLMIVNDNGAITQERISIKN